MPVTSQQGIGFCEYPPHPSWYIDWLDPVQVLCVKSQTL